MDLKMKKQLLEKYWNGETTVEEEQWLSDNIARKDPSLTEEERRYFEQLKAFSTLSPDEAFDMTMFDKTSGSETKVVQVSYFRKIRNVAAVVLLLATAGTTMYHFSEVNEQVAVVSTEQEEAEKAFELAKQSLLLISQKMNKGTVHIGALEKFDLTHDKINAKNKTE